MKKKQVKERSRPQPLLF